MGMLDFISPAIDLFGIFKEEQMANRENRLQEKFAQNGIRWKVEDAKAAGLHPLAALGTPTTSYQPAYGDSTASNYANLGQDLTRAIHSTRTSKEREEKLADLAVTSSELDNELKRAQLAKLAPNQIGPPGPSSSNIPGYLTGSSTNEPYVKENPVQVEKTEPGRMGKSAGAVTSYTYQTYADGAVGIIPSKDSKQATEDQLPLELQWYYNNLFLPEGKGGAPKPPKSYWPKGAIDMEWSPARGAFVPRYKGETPGTWQQWKNLYKGFQHKNNEKLLKTPRH